MRSYAHLLESYQPTRIGLLQRAGYQAYEILLTKRLDV
jgi:hypothetical protein